MYTRIMYVVRVGGDERDARLDKHACSLAPRCATPRNKTIYESGVPGSVDRCLLKDSLARNLAKKHFTFTSNAMKKS